MDGNSSTANISGLVTMACEQLNITTELPIREELLSPTGHYIIGTVLIIITVVGVVQNTSLLAALRDRTKVQATELITKVLLASDLLMCIIALPFAVTSSFHGRWVFGTIGCNWYGFSMAFLGLFNINLLTAISIERYHTVTRLMIAPSGRKKFLTRIMLGVSFALAFFWSCLPLIGVSSYVPEGVGTSCGINWGSRKTLDLTYSMLLLTFCFIVPLIIIVACHSRIYMRVKSNSWTTRFNLHGQLTRTRLKMEINLAKLIFLATGMYLFIWSPYAIVSLLQVFYKPEHMTPIMFTIPAIIAKCSAFVNSIVYVYMNRELREAILKKFVIKGFGTHRQTVIAAVVIPDLPRETSNRRVTNTQYNRVMPVELHKETLPSAMPSTS